MKRFATAAVCLVGLLGSLASSAAARVRVVAAENFYGDLAGQLAGSRADVLSVLSNPSSDPHLFEPTASVARAVADADLVILNGANYDPWMSKLISSARVPRRLVIEAASLLHSAAGANPHLWYDPTLMPAMARAVSARLQQLDPSAQSEYAQRLQQFLSSLQPIDALLAQLRARYAGSSVAATEPLAQYLCDAIGLRVSNAAFGLAVMNSTEPSARDTAAFEQSLRQHSVRALIFNRQVANSAVDRLLGIARDAHVPVVAFTETEPASSDYQQWMLGQLQALQQALAAVP